MRLPEPGQKFQDRYVVDDVIADGGFARVYAATEISLGRPVALKLLRPGQSGYDPILVRRFMREVRAVGALQDPHTLHIYECGRTDDGLLFIVFELLGGEDLSARLERGTMRENDAVRVIEQVLYSLREAHGLGILHRDIKPANIRIFQHLDDPLRTKLLDFGIAKSIVEADSSATRTGIVVGTPAFMSPEQMSGEALSPASDLYSVGLVLFDMVVGRERRPRDLSRVRVPDDARVSRGLRSVLQRLLAFESADRYGSATEVLQDLKHGDERELRGSTADSPGSEPRVAVVDPPPNSPRGPTVALFGGAALAVLAIGGVGFQVFAPEPPQPSVREVPFPALRPVEPSRELQAEPTTPPALEKGPKACGPTSTIRGHAVLSDLVGLDRQEYLVYVPESYDPERKHPLVLLLHDKSMSAKDFAQAPGLLAEAERAGIVVLAPDDDILGPWKDSSDFAMVIDGIEMASAEFCIDESRIYAVGLGRGSIFAEKLACKIPIAAVAATTYTTTVPSSKLCDRPAPLISIQARSNPFSPVEGGASCIASNKESVEAWNLRHADMRRCQGVEPAPVPGRPDCQRWSCEVPFTTCLVDGGHGWPGMRDRLIDKGPCNTNVRTFPYAAVIWEFFEDVARE